MIPKDDLLTIGKDLPESYTAWTRTGNTTMAGWPKEGVDMTFKFDFDGVSLETVFDLAVGALVIDSRPARKKEGFEFCRKNPTVPIRVADLKTRKAGEPRNLATVLARSLATGTTRAELGKMKREDRAALLAAVQELCSTEIAEAAAVAEQPEVSNV